MAVLAHTHFLPHHVERAAECSVRGLKIGAVGVEMMEEHEHRFLSGREITCWQDTTETVGLCSYAYISSEYQKVR